MEILRMIGIEVDDVKFQKVRKNLFEKKRMNQNKTKYPR